MSNGIGTQKKNGAVILSPQGRLIEGAGAELRSAILHHFEQGEHSILVDLAGVDHIDSVSIGELVSAFASITRRKGGLALLRPGKLVRETLRLTRLDQLFALHDSEAQALAALASDARRNLGALNEFIEE